MILNGTTLNGATLNGAVAGVKILMAIVTLGSASSVTAAPIVTRYCLAAPAGAVSISASPSQKFAARALVDSGVAIVAIVPRQQFASSAISAGAATVTADALATRMTTANPMGAASLLLVPRQITYGGAASGSASAIAASSSVRRPGNAGVTASGTVVSQGKRTCYGQGAVGGAATVTAAGGYSIAARSTLGGAVMVTAYGGYGIPSATVVTAQAVIYAKPTVKWSMHSQIALGSASVTANGLAGFACNAVITGTAQVYALPIQVQGVAELMAGIASVGADATYQYTASSTLSAGANVGALGYQILLPDVNISGTAAVRVETQINNLLEGFSSPEAVAMVIMNAQGVVVAPIISHFYGDATIEPTATYIHKATSKNAAPYCLVQATGVTVRMASVAAVSAATVTATGHWLWPSGAVMNGGGAEVEPIASFGYAAHADVTAGGSVTVIPRCMQMAKGTASSSVEVTGSGVLIKLATAYVPGNSTIAASSLGNPQARDPEERTMIRPYTDRILIRPFVDRVMEAQT